MSLLTDYRCGELGHLYSTTGRCLFCGEPKQDAGGLNPRAGAEFTRFSSRDLHGAGSRLHPDASDGYGTGHPNTVNGCASSGPNLTLAMVAGAGEGFCVDLPRDVPRFNFMADEFLRLKLFAAARHYRALASIESAGKELKTGQSSPQSTVIA
jgi:hypothetical protein